MKFYTSIIFYSMIFFLGFPSTGVAFKSGHQHTLSGQTMGTFYSIKFISRKKESLSVWQKKVDVRLKEVNKKLSMYDPKSELSKFNRQGIEKSMTPSADFFAILVTAKKLYHLTQGAWDGTVKPLVDLWGFGTQKGTRRIPEIDTITLALSKTGFNHIEITASRTILKRQAVTLDLGSIAKGYGVDEIAAIFTAAGIQDVLVEIGGELYASGRNKQGHPWSIGISKPDKQYANQELYKIIHLKDQAIATSGNYRNFFEVNGKTFSHIIDPRTGFPVDNQIVSASVISSNCTFADGLATALMVMEVEKGIQLVNRLENTECLIIQKADQQFVSHTSQNFDEFVVK